MDITTVPIINAHTDKLVIKYDFHNGDHLVYIGLDDQVRRLAFSTKELAGSFIKQMNTYRKLKVRI